MNISRVVQFNLLIILVAFFSTTCLVSASGDLPIAQVSLAKVYKDSKRVQQAITDLTKMQTDAAPAMKALGEETRKLQDTIQSGKDTSEKKENEKSAKELQDKMDELQSRQADLAGQVAARRTAIQETIKGQMDKIISDLAEKAGFKAVLMKESLVYSKGIIDITDQVTKALDSLPENKDSK